MTAQYLSSYTMFFHFRAFSYTSYKLFIFVTLNKKFNLYSTHLNHGDVVSAVADGHGVHLQLFLHDSDDVGLLKGSGPAPED